MGSVCGLCHPKRGINGVMRTSLPFARLVVSAIVLVGAWASAPASAQGIASNADEPRAGEEIRGDTKVVEIDEIERGVYLSVDYGPNYFIPIQQPGFVVLNPDYVRPGTRMGI